MLMSMCSVYDSVNDVFGRPMFTRTVGEAQRSFATECNNSDSELFKHPSDYSLYDLGQFDDSVGAFLPLPKPRLVSRASDLIKS